MLSRSLVYYGLLIGILIPPLLGAFVVPNQSRAISSWSMFMMKKMMCAGQIAVSADGESWAPWKSFGDGGSLKTPVVVTPRQALEVIQTEVCDRRPGNWVRMDLSCLDDGRTWTDIYGGHVERCAK